ncbi:hypothetical protein WDU94_000440, partial [Cyamophila willieti]
PFVSCIFSPIFYRSVCLINSVSCIFSPIFYRSVCLINSVSCIFSPIFYRSVCLINLLVKYLLAPPLQYSTGLFVSLTLSLVYFLQYSIEQVLIKSST